MTDSYEMVREVILLIAEITKGTTIFSETVYGNDAETAFDSLSIQGTVDKYIEELKAVDLKAEDKKKYTIQSKVDNNSYSTIESFYKDFVIVCFILINTLNKYSEAYYLIDKLYQIVSELILRNLSTSINSLKNNQTEEKDDSNINIPKALQKSFEIQFNSVSEFYEVSIKKQLQVNVQLEKNIIDRNGANNYQTMNSSTESLFSSILNKSILDKREDILPDKSMNFVDVLPVDISSTIEAPKLGLSLASTNKRIPDPTLPATRILTKYINPLWYKLPVNIWLKNLVPEDDSNKLQHILPIVSKNESLLNNCQAIDLWMKKTSYLVKYNGNEEQKKVEAAKLDALEQEELSAFSSSILTKKHTPLDHESDNEKPKIALQNLINWSELHYYTDEEITVLTQCDNLKSLQLFINKYIAKLIKLQQHRLKHTKATSASPAEIELYHKIQKLLKIVLMYSSKDQLKNFTLPTTKSVPVLQANYTGTLPLKKLSAHQSALNVNPSTTHTYSSNGKYRPKKYRKG